EKLALVKGKSEYILQALSHAAHIQAASNVGVNAPAHETVAKCVRIVRPFFGTELMLTLGTGVPPRKGASDPFFYSALEKLQIRQIVAHLLAFVNMLASALGTALAFNRVHFVDMKRGPLEPSLPFVDYLEMRIGAYEDFFALVIEIGALRDVLEVFGGVLLRPKQLPAWAIRGQFLSSGGFESSPQGYIARGIH